MGNCTGYCTGCKDGDATIGGSVTGGQGASRYDNNAVRNSYNKNDAMLKGGFGGEQFEGYGNNAEIYTGDYPNSGS